MSLRMTAEQVEAHQRRVGRAALAQDSVMTEKLILTGVGRGNNPNSNINRKGPPQTCSTCNVVFHAPPVLLRRGGGKFCSYACKGVSMRRPIQGRKCRNCGAYFETPDHQTRRCQSCLTVTKSKKEVARQRTEKCRKCRQCDAPTRAIFCNPDCYAKFRKANPIGMGLKTNSNCAVCERPFYASPGHRAIGQGKFCSIGCRPINKHPRSKGGHRPDLGIYVRSSWEANYARYLNWLKARGEIEGWQFEPDTFEFAVKRGSRFYTPDFKIFERGSHRYVEVKGYMDQRSRTKIDRFARHFKNERLEIVQNKEMRALNKSVGRLIPNWERNKNDKI